MSLTVCQTLAVTSGKQMREARDARRMTREELAAQVGCSVSWVKHLENLDELPDEGRFTAAIENLLGLRDFPGERADLDRTDPRLSRASTLALATELARRLAAERDAAHEQSNVEAFGVRGKTLRTDARNQIGDEPG